VVPRNDVFVWGEPVRLFTTETGETTTSDGTLFLVGRHADPAAGSEPMELVVNWARMLPR
jgi:hypothetical protein